MCTKRKFMCFLSLVMVGGMLIGCGPKAPQKKASLVEPSKVVESTKVEILNEKVSLESSNAEVDFKKIYFGNWEIKNILFFSSVSTYSNDELSQIIGKKISFSEHEAACFGDLISELDNVVKKPQYVEMSMSKLDFSNNYEVPMDKIESLNEDIVQISVMESDEVKCTFLVKDQDTLILIGGGAYLLLDRVKSKE